MADFDIPFARDSEKRYPSPTEKTNGFPCGPAARALFNGLIYRPEAEIKSVMDEAGIAHTDANMRGLLDAILALINASTGGGPAEDYILMSQLRAKMLHYPEVMSDVNGVITPTPQGAGTVRLPAGATIRHRGIYDITTVQTDFATVANKTYHLRMDMLGTGTPSLKDLADVAYNAGAVVETNTTFDSSYDNAILAKVTTNSSNIATIVPLVNKDRLWSSQGVVPTNVQGVVTNSARYDVIAPLNWSRTPKNRNWQYLAKSTQGISQQDDFDIWVYELGTYPTPGAYDRSYLPADRYRVAFTINDDFTSPTAMQILVNAAA